MNQQVLRIAMEANRQTGDQFDLSSKPVHDLLAKFADLLVRECTHLLPEDSIRTSDGVHSYYTIRSHFGVNEKVNDDYTN